MKRLLAAAILAATALGVAWAAEKFEDADLKLSVEPPQDFIKSDTPLNDNDFLGKPKALYVSPDLAETAGVLLIHHMDLGDATYEAFKMTLADRLKGYYGEAFEVVKQEDFKLGDREGFVFEYKCNGDGTQPKPDGDIPHHIRWRLVREGERKLAGFIYGSRESAWEKLSVKYAASEKTLKSLE